MMNSQIHISPEEWDLIEAYLNKHNGLNKTEFNKELAFIADLEEKTDHIQRVREEIEDSIRQSKIKGFHANLPQVESPGFQSTSVRKSKSHTVWYAMAAALVVLLGIFWILDQNDSPEKIFATHFKPDIGLPLKMSRANDYAFYEGMLAYKQENYTDAIAKWQVLLQENPESDTLNYFLGVAYLAEGDATKSLVFLEIQDRFREGMFESDAAYYAALAYIKTGKFEEAKALLRKDVSERNSRLMNDLMDR